MLALRIGQAHRPATHTRGAADDSAEADDAASPFLGFEAPQLHGCADVLAAHDLRRTGLPQRIVDALAAAAAVAVAVIEEARLALREHCVGLGELAEPLLRLRGLAHLGMPLPGMRVKGAAD